MTTEQITLPLDDGDIFVQQDGPRDAPVLLLVHGTAASARTWDALVPLLTGTHRVVRVDLLGCGRSAKPIDGSYRTPDQARRVGTVLDRLGVGRAVVLGHSSGGIVATALAEQRPELVAALVLVDTGPSMAAYIAPETAAIGPAQWPPTDEQIREFAATGFARPDFELPADLAAELRDSSFEVFAALLRDPVQYLTERALPDRLAALGKPLLVLFGAQDRRWRPSSAADYLVVPGARVEMLPDVGHTPIIEDPHRTAELVLEFAASDPVSVAVASG
ncbi:alpha/beta hydrolase [Actinocatenispora thailandica]|uniref:Alpha/beta hydrolase n=1 Tax=Actinocatenispora thailandica TaxID=227318 RepID=A0A7R7DVA6_9ACTN|nr:alpha/beta hydrolase [Actinocatenispora thailandica]BCJ38534.1 alpha/beta hydrolase [Actinocatenispora thailandica]